MNDTNALAVVMPNLFGDIDFSGLNATIEALGKVSGTITDAEKEQAVKVIDSWQDGVINRLKLRQQEAESLLATLNIANSCFYLETDQVEAMVAAVGCDSLYAKYIEKRDAYDAIIEPNYAQPYLEMTLDEQIEYKHKCAAEYQKHHVNKNRASYELGVALRDLKIALNADDKVKELIGRIGKFKRSTRKFELDCTEKSQLAKISIAISSEDARDALKQLLNFDIGI